MRAAAVFPLSRTLGIVDDFPEPQLTRASEVKVRILSVGVCGTDREIASFVYGTPPEGFEYLVLGHEAVAEVMEAGPEAGDLRAGDLVIPMVRHACASPACPGCRAERPDFCASGEYRERGIMRMHGFMTEMVVDDRRHLNPVPAALRDVAVLVEPLTIAEKALIQAAQVQSRLPWWGSGEGRKAVVLGAGPVGLLGAMALRRRGFDVTVYSLEREPNRGAEVARAIGARYFSTRDCTAEQMAAEAGPIDLVYEATGATNTAFEVLKHLGPNGLYLLTGVPGRHGRTEFATDDVMRNMVLKNQCLLGIVNSGKDAFEMAVADLAAFHAAWPEAVRGLITGRFPLENFAEPVLRARGIKNIVEIAPPRPAT